MSPTHKDYYDLSYELRFELLKRREARVLIWAKRREALADMAYIGGLSVATLTVLGLVIRYFY